MSPNLDLPALVSDPLLLRRSRERDGKLRTLAGNATNRDVTPMRADDLSGDCQPQARACQLVAVARTAIELLKDSGLLVFRDSGASIADGDRHSAFRCSRGDSYRNGRQRILQGVADELANRQLNQVGVYEERRQVLRSFDLNIPAFHQRPHVTEGGRHQGAGGMQLPV